MVVVLQRRLTKKLVHQLSSKDAALKKFDVA